MGTVTDRVRIASVQWQAGALDAAGVFARISAFADHMRMLAADNGINIIAGSHLVLDDDGVARNRSFVFLRDGTTHMRDKLHPTPTETEPWKVKGGATRGRSRTSVMSLPPA